MTPTEIADKIAKASRKGHRRLVAVVGPPASGKSTFAKALAAACDTWCVLPMDGYHLDNGLLDLRGLRARKGAPETFDVAGLCHLVARLGNRGEVFYPLFDRARDVSLNCAALVGPKIDTVIVEGNYLLLDDPGWRDLSDLWDLTIRLDVPRAELEARLMARWLKHGFSEVDARAKVLANDLPNAERMLSASRPADITIPNGN